MKSEIEKPKWMVDIENSPLFESNEPSTYLHLVPKDNKYSDLTDSILNFLKR